MSLKADFFDGLTGLHQKEQDAFNAGVTFITVDNLATISTALKDAAAAGKTKFVVTLITTYQPAFLRGNKGDNLILKSYLAGNKKGLSDQAIFDFECSPSLNVSDNVETKIDLNFNFQTT
jgi:hypothetical protein